MTFLGLSEYMTVFMSFTRASFLNMRADQSSRWLIRIKHFVTILPYLAFVKCPKMAILRHFLKFCFLKIFGFVSLVHYYFSSDSAFIYS